MLQGKSIVIYIGALFLALVAVLFGAYHYFFGGIEQDTTVGNMMQSQSSETGQTGISYDCVALLGIDTEDGDAGRSDAILLASIDRDQNKVRLCSIARDSRVEIAEHGHCKVNAAYAYGGGELTIQTLNENFDLELTSYIAVNFSGMADIVDTLGGVDVELSESEMEYMRGTEEGLTAGEHVHLNGEQAVAYSRIRYLDSDDMRTSRQREVLQGLLDQIRTLDEDAYPALMDQLLEQCVTNLSRPQLLAFLAQLTPSNARVSEYAIPSAQTKAKGETIDGTWYYVYDTHNAGEEIREFLGMNP